MAGNRELHKADDANQPDFAASYDAILSHGRGANGLDPLKNWAYLRTSLRKPVRR
jgi:hypothetical protein